MGLTKLCLQLRRLTMSVNLRHGPEIETLLPKVTSKQVSRLTLSDHVNTHQSRHAPYYYKSYRLELEVGHWHGLPSNLDDSHRYST
jgi:hypothetical protein